VPRSALRNDQQVLVVDTDNRIQRRDVEVIRIDREDVLIRLSLAHGERICISPLQVVIEGMQVEPIMAPARNES